MGRYKERPKYNVVSLRITDEEWEVLQQMKRASMKSISEILRDSIHLAVPQLDGFCGTSLFAPGDAAAPGQRA